MTEIAARQIVLASRPKGPPTAENFRLEEVPMPALPPGGLLLRVLYLSLDPYMRGRMDDAKSYAKPVGVGEVMTGESVCEVIASDRSGLCRRRYRAGAHRLAHARRMVRPGAAQARSEGGADHHRIGRPRHAWLYRLFGPLRHRQTEGGRNGGRCRRQRPGRLARRPARQDGRRPRRRHRRRS